MEDGRRLQSYAGEADRMLSTNIDPRSDIAVGEDGWTKSLLQMPFFDSNRLYKYLICGVTDAIVIVGAPNAYHNKKHGYTLWRDGYVKKVEVKPNVTAYIYVCL